MNALQSTTNLIGRILIAALFLPAGIAKLTAFDGSVNYFASIGIAMPAIAVVATIIVEVLGSLLLIIGYKTRIVAIGLAIFTLIASVTGHAYWLAPAEQAYVAQLLFYKNIAIIGGLIILATSGAGSISIDGKTKACCELGIIQTKSTREKPK
ncbi:MAG: DoxX family protein [Polynucleobacter sp.]|nr:DoxX family protein [Polynucleobacter sp.]